MKNKKGISLIVLVITIIVIIILAAAVILTLTDNNPISNAKSASIAQNKDSIESALNLYVAQKVAATQGTWKNSEIVTGSVPVPGTATGDDILDAGTAAMKITTGTASVNAAILGFYALDSSTFGTNVKTNVPTPPSGGTWYVDPASNKVYLVFAKDATPTWLEETNLTFVKELT